MIGLAILGQPWQAEPARHAEEEKHGAENDEHEVGDPVDHALEACRVFFVAHESKRDHKAHCS